jgi:ABC-type polysaccharide/polyol phosphate export permease
LKVSIDSLLINGHIRETSAQERSHVSFIGSIAKEARELYRYRWVTYSFVRSTLLLRYRRSLLGFVWSLLNPILNYIVVGFVFYMLSRGLTPNYFVYMFTGSAIFNLVSITANSATMIMLSNEHYIKKIYMPKSIFVLNSVLFELVNFIFSMTALIILGLIMGKITLSLSLLSLPFVLFFIILFNFGIASLLSVSTVFFRDFVHITPILTQALFFGTPILYTMELAPVEFRDFITYNPIFYLITCFREPFYSSQLAEPINYIVLVSLSLAVFIIGFLTLKHNENRIVFRL